MDVPQDLDEWSKIHIGLARKIIRVEFVNERELSGNMTEMEEVAHTIRRIL